MRRLSEWGSVTVSIQGILNRRLHARIDCFGSPQIPTALARDCLGKVAGTTAAMHRLAFGRQAEPLLGPLVSLDLALSLAFAHQFRPIEIR